MVKESPTKYYNNMKSLKQRLNENFNESVKLKTIPELIRHTDNKLKGWYKLAKEDYGVVGSGKTRVKGDEIFIDYVENGKKRVWSMAFHIEYLEYGADYFYNVWMEQAESSLDEALKQPKGINITMRGGDQVRYKIFHPDSEKDYLIADSTSTKSKDLDALGIKYKKGDKLVIEVPTLRSIIMLTIEITDVSDAEYSAKVLKTEYN